MDDSSNVLNLWSRNKVFITKYEHAFNRPFETDERLLSSNSRLDYSST